MDYQFYLQKAFRTVVHDVLKEVQEKGIEQACAYYLTFETNRSDVVLPDFVKAKYPKTITLVLENQFENLEVFADYLTVDLSFGGIYSTVTIPYRALLQFADPNHNFALTLNPTPPDVPNEPAKIIDLESLRALK